MRRSAIGLVILAVTIGSAGPAAATHHAGKTAHHDRKTGHHTPPKHAGSKAHARPESARPSGSGVTTVPAAGIKLRCAPGRAPLLVRKMTQGSGTTVTVICR